MSSDDDFSLFRAEMHDVEPTGAASRVPLQKPMENSPGQQLRRRAAVNGQADHVDGLASEQYIQMVQPRDVLSFKKDGIQHGVFKNLRLGKYAIDSRLDLHHATVNQARKLLFEFITDCVEQGIRCAIVTHGRGENRERPALLKSCTNHWLQQMEAVMAFHSAQPQHGGTGSTYVMLGKSEVKRMENLERHHKGKPFHSAGVTRKKR